MIDTISYLDLGQVFVAAMTGNLIFLGLGLTRLGSLLAPTVSISFYAVGAICGGRRVLRRPVRRAALLIWGTTVHAVTVGVAALIPIRYGFHAPWPRHLVLALLAFSMGWQYSIVCRLKVPDVTTTVVTTTITKLFGEAAGHDTQKRRALMISALLCGVLIAGLLRWLFGPMASLLTSGAILAVSSIAAHLLAGRPGAEEWNWTLPAR